MRAVQKIEGVDVPAWAARSRESCRHVPSHTTQLQQRCLRNAHKLSHWHPPLPATDLPLPASHFFGDSRLTMLLLLMPVRVTLVLDHGHVKQVPLLLLLLLLLLLK